MAPEAFPADAPCPGPKKLHRLINRFHISGVFELVLEKFGRRIVVQLISNLGVITVVAIPDNPSLFVPDDDRLFDIGAIWKAAAAGQNIIFSRRNGAFPQRLGIDEDLFAEYLAVHENAQLEIVLSLHDIDLQLVEFFSHDGLHS